MAIQSKKLDDKRKEMMVALCAVVMIFLAVVVTIVVIAKPTRHFNAPAGELPGTGCACGGDGTKPQAG